MSPGTHSQLANFIWSICSLLRGPYKHNEYGKVILPLTGLRRFDCLLAPIETQALAGSVAEPTEELGGAPFDSLHPTPSLRNTRPLRRCYPCVPVIRDEEAR